MAINRIEQLQRTTALPTGEAESQQRQARLELNTTSSFERNSTSDFDPANFQPSFTDDQRRFANERFVALAIADQQAIDAQVTRIASGISKVRDGSSTAADVGADFTSALTTYNSALSASNQAKLHTQNNLTPRGSGNSGEVTDIMIRVMGRVEDKVRDFAADLQGKLNMKKEARTELTEVRDMVANWPEGVETQSITWTEFKYDSETGEIKTITHNEELTKEQAVALQDRMEAQLETLSDITQQQQFELQQKYQDQQEAMQTLSEILRSMHDTMKNTIANVKAS